MCDLFTPSAGSLDPDFFFGPAMSPVSPSSKRSERHQGELSLWPPFQEYIIS